MGTSLLLKPQLEAGTKFSIHSLEPELGLPIAIIVPKQQSKIGVLVWTRGPNASTLTQAQFILEDGTRSNPYPVVCLCGICHMEQGAVHPGESKHIFELSIQTIDKYCIENDVHWIIVHKRPHCVATGLAVNLVEGLHSDELTLAFAEYSLEEGLEIENLQKDFPIELSQRFK